MTWLEFVSTTIGQLVWPILVIALVILLKEPIARLVGERQVKRLKAGPSGFELEFEHGLDEAKRELTQRQQASPELSLPAELEERASDFMEDIRAVARVDPSAAVVASFSRFECVLRDALERQPPDRRGDTRFTGLRSLARMAAANGLLSESEFVVLDELIHLRNVAAHQPQTEISYDQAVEFAELIRQMAISVRLAQGQTNDGSDPL